MTPTNSARSSKSKSSWGSLILALALALLALSVQWGVTLERLDALGRRVDIGDTDREMIKRDISSLRERLARFEWPSGARGRGEEGSP